MKKLIFLLIIFSIIFVYSTRASDFYLSENAVWTQDANNTHSPTFTIIGEGGVYTATELVYPYRTTSGSNASAVIATVFEWMTSDASVEFIGDFVWTSEITLNKNAYLNFTKANVTAAYDIILNILSPAVVVIQGGHWKGTVFNARIRFQSSSGNSIIDGIDATNFKLEFTPACGPYMTVKNCYFHDSNNLSYYIASNNQGYNTFQNCTFYNTAPGVGGIFVGAECGHCLFENCTFDNMGYHNIYLGSYSDVPLESAGEHIIRNCIFKNAKNYNQAGIHLKTQKCKIYNNIFQNMSGNAVPISLYSDWPYSNANYNEIYNNTFENLDSAIHLGR